MTTEVHLSDFACSCSDEDKAKHEAAYRAWLKDSPKEIPEEEFLTSMVYRLMLDFDEGIGLTAGIAGIFADQWCGVSVEVKKTNPETKRYEPYAEIFVQCDDVRYGLVRAYEMVKELYENEDAAKDE